MNLEAPETFLVVTRATDTGKDERMAVTIDEALTSDRFHYGPACNSDRTERWRRNGATKIWKTRPGEFRVPIKYGLRGYYYLTHNNADQFHTEANCPFGQV